MSDMQRTAAVEGEAPVNPYSLLEAVNSSSDTVNTAWLIFIAIMSYLLVAVAGVTHKDLLLSSDITLPVLQVRIDLSRFFLFAPIVLAIFHLGVVLQLVMLARKTLEFDAAIRMLEATDKRTHPLRLELHNFFFVQAIAGAHRSRIMGAFLHVMSWLTLVILPVVLLLYVQVVFLPYHDVAITWAHRVAVLMDIALLILIGVFLTRTETSFPKAFARQTIEHPIAFTVTSAVLIAVATFSLFVATVPGEALDRAARSLSGIDRGGNGVATERASQGFALPFFGSSRDGLLFGMFERNLNVTDVDLVVDKDVTPGESSLNLRGRDLRYARLDRTDLHQADLTGADLEGASLVGADLRGVTLQCADMNDMILTDDRVSAKCTNARRANLTRARLKEARMSGVDLRGARLEDADLEGAELAYALLSGASFYNARLERADLTGGANLHGANFGTASMQGADLTGARLYGADFTSAGLQGAVLAHAYLMGATLRDADLEGADLYKAKLQGADLRGAKIRAASLREASIFLATPPDRDGVELADLSGVVSKEFGDVDAADIDRQLLRLEPERLRTQVREALAPLMKPEARKVDLRGTAGQQGQGWTALLAQSSAVSSSFAGASGSPTDVGAKDRLTQFLAKLACKSRWANGSVATGLAKRAQGLEFKGDIVQFYDRLRADDCPAFKTMSRRALRSLSTAVDIARGN